jgi:hypothetical protein
MIVITELLALIAALKAANLPFAVCGGLAMAIHGYPRATQDIDLLVREENLQNVLAAAKSAGFWIPSGRMPFRPKTPEAMEIYRVSKAAGSVLIPLDLMIVTPFLEDVWNTRVEGMLNDVRCEVVSREGLIKMKSVAGRKQDLSDIEKLSEDGRNV